MLCPYCNHEAEFISSKEFYGKDFGTNMYVCRPCDARVGTHGRGKTPLGTLANAELRNLRMQCHAKFDHYWKSGRCTRSQAYKWLQELMNLSSEEAHIGMFREEQCKKLLRYLG